MDNEIERDQQSLKPLFPELSEEDLKAVESTFYGYLEIAWRIFERIEAEQDQKAQEIPDQPEFESPRGSALF
jgi:hypothetical protein